MTFSHGTFFLLGKEYIYRENHIFYYGLREIKNVSYLKYTFHINGGKVFLVFSFYLCLCKFTFSEV